MKVIAPTFSEIAFRQCSRLLMMNPLVIPTYYSTLFATFKSLLTEEHALVLQYQIDDVEGWLSDDLNKMNLQEAELRMYNNLDLLSGFQVRGEFLTQMMINEKLEKIKGWLTSLLYQYLKEIRFTTPIRMD